MENENTLQLCMETIEKLNKIANVRNRNFIEMMRYGDSYIVGNLMNSIDLVSMRLNIINLILCGDIPITNETKEYLRTITDLSCNEIASRIEHFYDIYDGDDHNEWYRCMDVL